MIDGEPPRAMERVLSCLRSEAASNIRGRYRDVAGDALRKGDATCAEFGVSAATITRATGIRLFRVWLCLRKLEQQGQIVGHRAPAADRPTTWWPIGLAEKMRFGTRIA